MCCICKPTVTVITAADLLSACLSAGEGGILKTRKNVRAAESPLAIGEYFTCATPELADAGMSLKI